MPKVSTVFWKAFTVRVFFKLSDDSSSKLQQNKAHSCPAPVLNSNVAYKHEDSGVSVEKNNEDDDKKEKTLPGQGFFNT